MKTAVTVFSGMGGSAYGLKKAGLKDLLFIEKDELARNLLKQNFPDVPIYDKVIKDVNGELLDGTNVLNISGQDILDKIKMDSGDLFLYQSSAPCQDFSTANTKVKSSDITETKNLFWESIEHIKVIQPHAYVFENVLGLRNDRLYPKLLQSLYELNYYFNVFEMNSIDYGSAQSRPRLFFVGYRKDLVDDKHGSLEDEIKRIRKANNGRVTENYDEIWLPSPPPMTTPELKDQVKINHIIKDAVLFFSTQFQGTRKNPSVSSMPTILTSPTFYIIRKGMEPGRFWTQYDDDKTIRKPAFEPFDMTREEREKEYHKTLDSDYDDFEKMIMTEDVNLSNNSDFMKDLIKKLESDRYPNMDEKEKIEYTTNGFIRDFGRLSEMVVYNFKFMGDLIAKYLPTREELLQFSDFPVEWNTKNILYEDLWLKCGDILMPKMMQSIAEHIVKELK